MMNNLHNWSAKGIFDRDQRVDGNLDLMRDEALQPVGRQFREITHVC